MLIGEELLRSILKETPRERRCLPISWACAKSTVIDSFVFSVLNFEIKFFIKIDFAILNANVLHIHLFSGSSKY